MIGLSGQPIQNDGGRGGIGLLRYDWAFSVCKIILLLFSRANSLISLVLSSAKYCAIPSRTTFDTYSPAIGNIPLP